MSSHACEGGHPQNVEAANAVGGVVAMLDACPRLAHSLRLVGPREEEHRDGGGFLCVGEVVHSASLAPDKSICRESVAHVRAAREGQTPSLTCRR